MGNFVFSSSPSRLVSVGQAAELLGVCINTVRRMCSRGELQFTTTFGKHRRIHLSEIRRWQGFDEVDDSIRKTLIYARVSGRRQKVEGNLSRQVDRLKVYCESLGEAKENLICISEQGSGLSETRTGYLKLLDLVIEGRIGRIVVEHRDRLARYGVVVLETLCEKFGVEILITHQKQDISEDEEMTLDILNLITVFSARRHGRRNGLTTTMPINDELRERIIQLHEQGQGMTRIARKIREEGFHCEKTNKPHAINSVRKTLKAYEKLKKATSTLLPNTKNSLKKFIKEMCSSSKESKVFTRPLFKAYAAWCLKNQIEAGSSRRMTEQLMRDYETGANCYRYMFVKGLALKGNPLASEGPEG